MTTQLAMVLAIGVLGLIGFLIALPVALDLNKKDRK